MYKPIVRMVCGMMLVAAMATPVAAQTPLLTVKNGFGGILHSVDMDANLLTLGTSGQGTIPATGAGMRFMWYAKKAAFRSGSVTGTEWDDANTGAHSVAMGHNTIASGDRSLAMGQQNTASGFTAVALGYQTTASGSWGTTLGYGTVASAWYSTAMGHYTTASGVGAIAMGSRASSNGFEGTFVFGDRSDPNDVMPTAANQFVIRAQGGAFLRSIGGLVATGTWQSGAAAPTGEGTRMVWNPRKAAFRAGYVGADQWNDASIGHFSTALGMNVVASGIGSTAIGHTNNAIADYATALGWNATASGQYAVAHGFTVTASGNSATAMGANTTASGANATAMGRYASTNGFSGSFIYGDASTVTPVLSTAYNQFMVRASGGTIIYSSSALTAGVSLAAGGGAWASISDVNKKHLFTDLDGEVTLAKIRAMPIREWSYKSQDASTRHLGPTAQDFYAAFKLGESNLTITTTDIDGVNLLAAQALEKRTRELQAEMAAVRAENADLRAILAETLLRIDRLEADASAGHQQ